jgi:hypothetical protein
MQKEVPTVKAAFSPKSLPEKSSVYSECLCWAIDLLILFNYFINRTFYRLPYLTFLIYDKLKLISIWFYLSRHIISFIFIVIFWIPFIQLNSLKSKTISKKLLKQ